MPIANIRVPASVFDDTRRERIVADLSDAIALAEQIPDDPGHRSRIVIIWEETDPGRVYVNGADLSELAVPVFLDLQPPAHALTEDRAAAFAADVDRIFTGAAPDDRAVVTSVVMHDVPDGRWGISGSISRIADFARTAGYRHLQHLVE